MNSCVIQFDGILCMTSNSIVILFGFVLIIGFNYYIINIVWNFFTSNVVFSMVENINIPQMGAIIY